jgi:malonyl CoA-acyl carrier protein transacylase
MADRKAELERKKAKLQAIREEKERRRREKEQKEVSVHILVLLVVGESSGLLSRATCIDLHKSSMHSASGPNCSKQPAFVPLVWELIKFMIRFKPFH